MKHRRALADILYEDPNPLVPRSGDQAAEARVRAPLDSGSMLGTGLWFGFALLVTAASVGLWTFIVTGVWKLAVHLIGLLFGG